MATCFGDSSYVDHCYNLRKPSVSSASSRPSDNKVSSTNASKTTKTQTPAPEGLEDTKVHKFTGIAAMRKIVDSQSNKLKAGGSDQYLIFKPVTTKDLADIDRHRRTIGMHTRVTHYIDTDTLVIKLMPSVEDEASHATFGQKVYAKSLRMGMADHDLNAINAGRFVGPNSSKEGDTTYKPAIRSKKADLPTLVIESGVSEKLSRLRVDANWWLSHPSHQVNIVILIAVDVGKKEIKIEKWELAPAPARRSTRQHPNLPGNPPQVPTLVHEISIDSNNNVTGAPTPPPLILEFQKVVLRPAVLPESDFTFTSQELSQWAANLWGLAQ